MPMSLLSVLPVLRAGNCPSVKGNAREDSSWQVVAQLRSSFLWWGVLAVVFSSLLSAQPATGCTNPQNPSEVQSCIWTDSSAPAVVDGGGTSAIEVGVKFTADTSGYITGIRFYKSAANTGTHVGNLWSSSGTLLATATFTGETASGWQEVSFSTPVLIAANTTYVASYHTNSGHTSDDPSYFANIGVDNAPLHALASGVSGGNGVYALGTSSAFPHTTNAADNYWVDVAFQTEATVPGLVGYWKFDDGSGTTAADSSGNGYTATLFNGIGWITGEIGGAISANGVNQYGSIPAINLSSTQAVTVAFWANRTYSTSGGHTLIRKQCQFQQFHDRFRLLPRRFRLQWHHGWRAWRRGLQHQLLQPAHFRSLASLRGDLRQEPNGKQ